MPIVNTQGLLLAYRGIFHQVEVDGYCIFQGNMRDLGEASPLNDKSLLFKISQYFKKEFLIPNYKFIWSHFPNTKDKFRMQNHLKK